MYLSENKDKNRTFLWTGIGLTIDYSINWIDKICHRVLKQSL